MSNFRTTPCAVVCLAFLVAATAAAAQAGDEADAPSQALRHGLSALDWGVVALYAIAMLAIGVYYARRTETSEDYYLGGRRMKPSMVGLSLFATLLSTISYLAVPGEVMQHGPAVLTGIAALPAVFLIVGYILIPYITKLPITSAYEILEGRLGRSIRLMGSALFILIRLVWMGLVVFSAAKVVVSAGGLEPSAVPYAVCTLGLVTVIYSSMGGLKAVVLTDVIQTGIMFLGALVCVVIISVKMGGVGWFPTQWAPNWDVQPWFSLDPTVRVTVFGTMVYGTLWWICTAGSDQMAIQRYLATRDARAARRAFLVNNVADAAVTVLLALLGLALLGFYRAHPEHLSKALNLKQDADYLFPRFIVGFMGYGLAGLVISGLLAAAMSSLSSGVNSASTVVNTDIIEPLLEGQLSERRKVRLAKWVSLLVGVVVILLGLLMGRVPGNLYEVTGKTNGLFVAPLFGLFFMAVCVPFATPFGAAFGSIYGFVAAFLFAFWDLTGGPRLSFQWILPVSLAVNIVAGCLLSLIPTRDKGAPYKTLLAALCAAPLVVAVAGFVALCIAE